MYSLTVLEARRPAWVSIGCRCRGVVSPGALRGSLSLASSASCISWLLASSSIFKGHHSNLLILSVIRYPSASYLQGLVITFGATWRIPIISPPQILNLVTSAKSLLPYQFSGIRTWTSLGGPLFSRPWSRGPGFSYGWIQETKPCEPSLQLPESTSFPEAPARVPGLIPIGPA